MRHEELRFIEEPRDIQIVLPGHLEKAHNHRGS